METIRQDGKVILHSEDGVSIKMIFNNLTGRNFKGKEYSGYIRHVAIGGMGFTPGSIEHCKDGKVTDTGTIPDVRKAENPMKLAASSDFQLSGTCSIMEYTAAQTPPLAF